MNTMGIVYVAIGLTLGAVIGWLLARQKLSGEVIRKEERIKACLLYTSDAADE